MISFKTLCIFLGRTFQGICFHCYISHLELLPVYEDGFLYSISQYCQISAQGCFSFHMNQSIRVPVFLPNLRSQPSGKLNFTHLDPVRTLGFLGVGKGFFYIKNTELLRRMPRLSLAFFDSLQTKLILPKLCRWTSKDML